MFRKARRHAGLDRSADAPVVTDPRAIQAAAGAPFDIADLTAMPRARNEAVIRNLCVSTYLGGTDALCRVLGRYKLVADTDDHTVSMHLLLDGYWEMWLTEAIAALVKPGMKAVDAGANLGYFSLLMADLVGPSGSVHCFEPNPHMARRLRTSLAMNGFAERAPVHQLALGEHARTATLRMPAHEPGAASIALDVAPTQTLDVRVERLDAIAGMRDADFIKIDVEGAETEMWRGMGDMLKNRRPLTVVMEFLARRYADPAAFLGEMSAAGFAMSVIEPGGGIVPHTSEQLLTRPGGHDHLLLLTRA